MEYELQYSLNLFIRALYRSNNWTWHLLFQTTNNTISIDEGLAYELSAVEIFHVDTSEFIDHSMKRAHALTDIRRKRQQGVVRAAWPSR